MVLSKQELIAQLKHEIHVLVHLCSKVKPDMLDFRPTPKQRSIMELLRYLTVMGPVLVDSIRSGGFLVDSWNAAEARAAQMNFDDVVNDLASQASYYEESIGKLSDEDLRAVVDMFGHTAPRGPQLVSMVLNGHAAYRMQLFCYLKACGREELNTMNLWLGVDGAM